MPLSLVSRARPRFQTKVTGFLGLSVCAAAVLVGCAPSLEATQTKQLAARTVDCIKLEAKRISQKPVDLDTATAAVVGACSPQINAQKSALIASFPGYREQVNSAWREDEEVIIQGARNEVALNRTN
jgi:hypothetical protein